MQLYHKFWGANICSLFKRTVSMVLWSTHLDHMLFADSLLTTAVQLKLVHQV